MYFAAAGRQFLQRRQLTQRLLDCCALPLELALAALAAVPLTRGTGNLLDSNALQETPARRREAVHLGFERANVGNLRGTQRDRCASALPSLPQLTILVQPYTRPQLRRDPALRVLVPGHRGRLARRAQEDPLACSQLARTQHLGSQVCAPLLPQRRHF
jgi:hypothetical protein